MFARVLLAPKQNEAKEGDGFLKLPVNSPKINTEGMEKQASTTFLNDWTTSLENIGQDFNINSPYIRYPLVGGLFAAGCCIAYFGFPLWLPGCTACLLMGGIIGYVCFVQV